MPVDTQQIMDAADKLGQMVAQHPAIDWRAISTGFGVESGRAETMEQFAELYTVADKSRGPFLIELLV